MNDLQLWQKLALIEASGVKHLRTRLMPPVVQSSQAVWLPDVETLERLPDGLWAVNGMALSAVSNQDVERALNY